MGNWMGVAKCFIIRPRKRFLPSRHIKQGQWSGISDYRVARSLNLKSSKVSAALTLEKEASLSSWQVKVQMTHTGSVHRQTKGGSAIRPATDSLRCGTDSKMSSNHCLWGGAIY